MAIAACCRLEKLISRDRIKRYESRDVGYKPTDHLSRPIGMPLATEVKVFGYGVPGNRIIQLYAAVVGEAPACQAGARATNWFTIVGRKLTRRRKRNDRTCWNSDGGEQEHIHHLRGQTV